jgi:hypothetical protein
MHTFFRICSLQANTYHDHTSQNFSSLVIYASVHLNCPVTSLAIVVELKCLRTVPQLLQENVQNTPATPDKRTKNSGSAEFLEFYLLLHAACF